MTAKDTYANNLRDVNARINTRNIKGKDYAEVNQRILAFWELFPDGSIETERLNDDGKRCDFVARAYRCADERVRDMPAATGHAYETREGMVNSTSYVENCETSAVGRALGMLGIGATEAIATAEEVENAVARQQADKPQKAAGKAQKRTAARKGADAAETPQEAPQAATGGKWEGVRYWLDSARQCGLTDADVAAWCERNYPGVSKQEYGGAHIAALEAWLREYTSGGGQRSLQEEITL